MKCEILNGNGKLKFNYSPELFGQSPDDDDDDDDWKSNNLLYYLQLFGKWKLTICP